MCREIAADMRHQVVEDLIAEFMPPQVLRRPLEYRGLRDAVREKLTMDLPIADWAAEEGVDQSVHEGTDHRGAPTR